MNIVAGVIAPALEAGRVRDRLEGRSGLAVALADDVEVRLVLGGRLAVEVGAADVGEHGAGAVVHRHDRVVVDVAALELADPAGAPASPYVSTSFGVAEPVHVVADARPLLGRRLVPLVVERGDDAQPAGVEQVLALEQVARLAPHGVHEVRGEELAALRRGQDDLGRERLVVLRPG